VPHPILHQRPDPTNKNNTIDNWSIDGRIIIDSMLHARREMKPDRESLAFITEKLGLTTKGDFDAAKIDELWADKSKEAKEYCLNDAKCSLEIVLSDKVDSINKAIALGGAVNLPLDKATDPFQGSIGDSLLVPVADSRGYLVPNYVKGGKKKIKGAFVYPSKGGLFKNIGSLDFKSLYPSIIIDKNVCFSTFIPPDMIRSFDGDYVTSPTGASFATGEVGIVPGILKELMAKRVAAKKKVKVDKAGEGDYYDRLQYALKVAMNGFYGLMASSFYRFTNRAIGESITAWGRVQTLSLIEKLEGMKYEIIASDTDSAYILLPDGEATPTHLENLATKLSSDGYKVDAEKFFSTFFTHGAKKRYVGNVVWPEKSIGRYTRGYQTRRKDAFPFLKTTLEGTFDRILSDEPDRAREFFYERYMQVVNRAVPLEELVTTKGVKDPKHYVNPASMASIKAMRNQVALGYYWVPGMKVSWIVVPPHGSPQNVVAWVPRNIEAFERREITPDWRYYQERIEKSLEDIVDVMGYDLKTIRTGKVPSKQMELGDF